MKWVCALGVQRVMESLPMRGAWIEIFLAVLMTRTRRVAPHAGSVD